MQVGVVDGYTDYKWLSVIDGVVAPVRFVGLGFVNGSLSYFVDNWQYYGMGDRLVRFSESDADHLALAVAQNHNWSVPLDADAFSMNNFNLSNVQFASLVYDGSVGADVARGDDLSVLYPVWRIGIALDKWYGNLHGVEVDVWADTGQVRSVQEIWSSMTPQEESILGPSANVSQVAPKSVITSTFSISGFGGLAEGDLISFMAMTAVFSSATVCAFFVSYKAERRPVQIAEQILLKISGGGKSVSL